MLFSKTFSGSSCCCYSFSEAANRCVLQIICSAAARKLKLDMMPGDYKRLKTTSQDVFLGSFNGFYQNYSCRTHQNSTREICEKFLCRTPPIFPGAKNRENTCLVSTVRWLLSIFAFVVVVFFVEIDVMGKTLC